MSSNVKHEPKREDANTPPKKMSNEEIWLKILADQKLISEEVQKGSSLEQVEKKHGFRFAPLSIPED